DDPQVLHDERSLGHQANEVLVAADAVDLILAPAEHREAEKIASVRIEQRHLEVLDPAVGLQLPVELDGLVEDLERTVLPAAYHLAPADEQPGVSHGASLESG